MRNTMSYFDNMFDSMFDSFAQKVILDTNSIMSSFVLKDNKYTTELDVPGFTKEQLTIEVLQNEILLKVTGKNEKRTISYTIPIPREADTKKSAATLENGVLTISLELKNPEKSTNTIKIS